MYIGGLRTRDAQTMLDKYPSELVTTTVSGMLPKNRLGKAVIKKLFVYGDSGKSHEAQKPIKYTIK
jgi:large subunit ribosomal protein L13